MTAHLPLPCFAITFPNLTELFPLLRCLLMTWLRLLTVSHKVVSVESLGSRQGVWCQCDHRESPTTRSSTGISVTRCPTLPGLEPSHLSCLFFCLFSDPKIFDCFSQKLLVIVKKQECTQISRESQLLQKKKKKSHSVCFLFYFHVAVVIFVFMKKQIKKKMSQV